MFLIEGRWTGPGASLFKEEGQAEKRN